MVAVLKATILPVARESSLMLKANNWFSNLNVLYATLYPSTATWVYKQPGVEICSMVSPLGATTNICWQRLQPKASVNAMGTRGPRRRQGHAYSAFNSIFSAFLEGTGTRRTKSARKQKSIQRPVSGFIWQIAVAHS